MRYNRRMTAYSTIVIANRLPIKVEISDGKLKFIQSDGGLPTALSSLDGDDRIWIGWPGIADDKLTDQDRQIITERLQKQGCHPVFLSQEEIDLFYEGYSNDTLWPLFHYFQTYMVNRDEYWQAYEKVNQKYAAATKSVAKADSLVWIHDYHLMILPKMLRQHLPKSQIGYFHHTPFPSYEVFRLLPERREIIDGLLGADLVGFHIYDYAKHFLNCCLRIVGIPNEYGLLHVDGRKVRVDSFPIGIDPSRFDKIRGDKQVQQSYQSLSETYHGQDIILSVDRLDYSKGMLERLEGYRRFLEDNPEYLGQVAMIMVVSPSRTGVETYQELQDKIDKKVSQINGAYGSAEWTPISYQSQTLTLEEIVPLFMAADTMLVTPRRDGMNLVAKEYVSTKGDIPGVLILSELAGAAEEMPEALLINPNDTLAISRAIKQSFEMSDKEKLERLAKMQKRIRDHPVADWGKSFLSALKQVKSLQEDDSTTRLGGKHQKVLISQFKNAKNRLLMLDYDGTLRNFVNSPSPSAAAPSQELHDLIASLASKPQTTVCIISGRSQEALETWFGDTEAILVAEHGAYKRENGKWQSHVDVDFESTRKLIKPLLKDYTSRTPGAKIEAKDFAMVWHYRNVPVELALVRSYNLKRELHDTLGDEGVSVNSGNKIIEVKPTSISKKIAATGVIKAESYDFVLAAGDDYTDEDMFASVPKNGVTVKIGPGETSACYRLPNVEAMISTLQDLLAS